MEKLRKKVYVTRPIPGQALTLLSKQCDVTINNKNTPPSKSELLENARGKDAILCMLSDRIDADLMDTAGPQLKVISSYSTGFEHIDIIEATKRGIYVTFTSDILAEATADLTFALVLSCARRVVEADRYVRAGKWDIGWMPDLFPGSDVYGMTMGILGLGRIGRSVAKRARGFDMQIIYSSRTQKPDLESSLGLRFVDIDTLLNESDFLCIHTSMNESTFHLIDKDKLKKMKNTSYIINTSRGSVIDENDLVLALKNKWIAGAGLDVYENEPLNESNKLLEMENVVVLPHIGSATHQTRNKMAHVSVSNILNVLTGSRPIYLVNPDVMSTRPLESIE